MFFLTGLKYQLLHNKGRNLLLIFASLVLLGAITFYLSGLQANRSALKELGEKIPVRVQIVTEDGSRNTGLFIHKDNYDRLINTGVRDVRATVIAAGALSETARMAKPFLGGDVTILGLSSARAMPLTNVEYHFAAGFDETVLESDRACCILEESFAESSGFSVGDAIALPVYFYPRGWGEYLEMGEKSLAVVGTFSTRQPCRFSLLVPAGWLRAEAEAQEMKYFGYDSLSMTVDDPLRLKEFKDRLAETGIKEPVGRSTDLISGSAAVIEDEIYTRTADKIKGILQVYQRFLVPFFLLIAGLSCLVIFLVLRNSRRDMAIACSLGESKAQIRRTYFSCILVLYLLGSVAALPFSLLFSGIGAAGVAAVTFLFLCCGGVGAALGLFLLLRFDPMALLTRVD